MINEITLKGAIVSLVSEACPEMNIYGQGQVEGWIEPALFIEMALTNQTDETINIVSKTYSVMIQHRDESASEADKLEIFQRVQAALKCIDGRNRRRKMVIKVTDEDGNDRFIHVSNLLYVWTGDSLDILQMQFNLNFYDSETIVDPEPMMENIEESMELKTEVEMEE